MVNSRTSQAIVATSILLTVQARRSNTSRPTKSSRRTVSMTANSSTTTTAADPSSVFGCGTDLHHAIATLSTSSLCPSGLDSHCPQNQHCYAGLPSSSQQVKAMHSLLEGDLIQHAVEERLGGFLHQPPDESFVCAPSYRLAVEAVCHDSSSTNNEGIASSTSSQGPIHCSSGEAACPSDMKCFASVSCPQSSLPNTQALSSDFSNPSSEASSQVLFANYEMAQNLSTILDHDEKRSQPTLTWYQSLMDYSNRLNVMNFASF